MRQAITTKYIPPTNYLGARVRAKAQAGAITVPWDDELEVDENHRRAAIEFARKWEWHGRLVGGALPNGEGYAFTFIDKLDKVTRV